MPYLPVTPLSALELIGVFQLHVTMAEGERILYPADPVQKRQSMVGSPDLRTLINMIAASADAVCLTAPGGSVLSVSSPAAALFGYSSLGFRKQHIQDFFVPGEAASFPLNERVKVPGFAAFDGTGLTKKGIPFRVQVTMSTVWDVAGNFFYTILFRDLSVQVQKEQEMDLLLRNMDEPFILLDRKLTILTFNEQLYQLHFSIRHMEIRKGDCILDHALPERKTFLRNIYKRVLNGEEVRDEIERLLPDKKLHRYTVLYRPARNAKEIIEGIFIIIREVPAEKQ